MVKAKVHLKKNKVYTITVGENPETLDININKFLDKKRIQQIGELFEKAKSYVYKIREVQETGKKDYKAIVDLKETLKQLLENVELEPNILNPPISNTDVHVLSSISFIAHVWITGIEVEFSTDTILEIYLYEYVNLKSPNNVDRKPFQVRIGYHHKTRNIRLYYNLLMKTKQHKKTLEQYIEQLLSSDKEQIQETPVEAT